MCKKLIVVVALLALMVPAAFAGTGPANVGITPHNLGAWQPNTTYYNTYSAKNVSEVCVFCHTPHGGTLDAPLWNRDLSSLAGTNKFLHYTSATMSSALSDTTRQVNAESLTCLGCHDGSLSVGDIINPGPEGAPDNNVPSKTVQKGAGTNPGPRIGGSTIKYALGDTTTQDLRDDHPISFSYTASATAKPGSLQAVSYVENTKQLVLFGAAENVECATCHDPHVDYINNPAYDPFLAIPNAGSDLCLSCHIK